MAALRCNSCQILRTIIFILVTCFLRNVQTSYNLYLGLMLPRDQETVAIMSINDVNKNIFSGSGMKLKASILPREFQCKAIDSIGITSRLHYSKIPANNRTSVTGRPVTGVDAYIGPSSSNFNTECHTACLHAGELVSFLRKPMFTPSCINNFQRTKNVDTFVRTAFLPIDFKKAAGKKAVQKEDDKNLRQFNRLLDIFQWKKITVIVSKDWYKSAQDLQGRLRIYNKSVEVESYNGTKKGTFNAEREWKFNRTITRILNLKTRIFFLHGAKEEIARILVLAREEGKFNGEYGFITTGFDVNPEWAGRPWMKGYSLETAFDGFVDFNTPTIPMNKSAKFRKRVQRFMSNTTKFKVTEEHAFIYDSIQLYARAYKSTKGNGSDPDDVRELMKQVRSTRFEGKSGFVEINSHDDRVPLTYELNYFQYQKKIPACRRNLSVETVKEKLPSPCSSFTWPGGKDNPPPDTPKCGYKECPSKIKTIVFAIVAVIIIGLTLAAFVLYKRNKYGKDDLVGKGFIVEASEIDKLMKVKHETESNPSYEQNGKAGGSISSKSPMLQHNEIEMKKTETERMPDTYSVISATESLRERNVFKFKGQMVMLKHLIRGPVNLSKDKSIRMEFKAVREIHDQHLCPVISVCIQEPHVAIIEQWCSKRSLVDILQNDNIDLDPMFKISFASDIAHGMTELHRNGIVHGRLTSNNVVIDNRWGCKITDYGMDEFRREHYENVDESDYQSRRRMLWKAPELLADDAPDKSKEGDVYSYGIILSEILTREDPYADYNMDAKDIIEQVKARKKPPFRPTVPSEGDSQEEGILIKAMESCWDDNPSRRQTFDNIKTMVKPKGNMLDNMVTMLEKYSNNLEEMVAERTSQLSAEQEKNDELLYKMLPVAIADQLKNGKEISATSFDCVTIFFSDIVGFTAIAAQSTPMQVVALLNDLYTCFDTCSDAYDVYKVETIGDAYMVVSGLPTLNGNKHAGEIATMSLDLLHHIKSFRIRHVPDIQLQLRVGIHSGPCVAGVVGLKMPRYCLFGDTVNYASRMESSGLALRIHVSPECQEILNELGGYELQDRGPVEMKGKGTINTYFLTGRDTFTKSLPDLSLAAGLDQHEFK